MTRTRHREDRGTVDSSNRASNRASNHSLPAPCLLTNLCQPNYRISCLYDIHTNFLFKYFILHIKSCTRSSHYCIDSKDYFCLFYTYIIDSRNIYKGFDCCCWSVGVYQVVATLSLVQRLSIENFAILRVIGRLPSDFLTNL